ncbi:MAG TPA: ferrous iron transport protein A [Deltaproteobacteria bacterium]|nr:MAG: hypothetical protein DRG83_01145 [Deltaproteobacteria bacterium]HEC31480.1 ferrous iron transport protein A [Deltaproteobacteria bacterium]
MKMQNEKCQIPLTMVGEGERVKLCGVNAGRCLQCRLASMGLVAGAEIQVVRNSFRGPFVVKVGNCRLILGRGVTHKIMVE